MSRTFLIRAELFLSGVKLQKIYTSLKKVQPPGALHTRGGGVEYLIITKKRLVLASVPIASFESFFHQGLKHTVRTCGVLAWHDCLSV